MNRDQKNAVIQEVAAQIEGSDAIFAVDYRGISVPQAAELRTRLREADARFRVVKNTLTERAAEQAGASGLKDYLEGPTAMTFVNGDAALAAKALADFRRANAGLLGFKGGWMNGAPLTPDQIDAIAALPSRDVLYGRLVGMVASPLTGLAAAMGGLIGGLARQLQAIADQGLVGAGAPAAAADGGPTGGDAGEAAAEPPAAGGDQPDPDAEPASTPGEAGPHPDNSPGETPSES